MVRTKKPPVILTVEGTVDINAYVFDELLKVTATHLIDIADLNLHADEYVEKLDTPKFRQAVSAAVMEQLYAIEGNLDPWDIVDDNFICEVYKKELPKFQKLGQERKAARAAREAGLPINVGAEDRERALAALAAAGIKVK